MKAIISKLFIIKFKSINVIHLINAGLIILYAGTFPMLIEQQATLSEVLKSMPEALMKALGVNSATMSTFEGYMATKHIMPIWIIILLTILIPAGTFISKSLDNKTGELIFTQPISRVKATLSVFLSALLQVFYFIIVSILIVIPICWIFGINVSYINYIYFVLESLGFAFFLTSLVFTLDAFLNDGGKVSGLIILFTIGSYTIDIVSKVITDLDFTKYFSVFYYYNPTQSLGGGELNLPNLLLFTVLGLTLLGVAIYRYNSKDLVR